MQQTCMSSPKNYATYSKKNHLISALPADVQERLVPNLELVELPLGEVLYEPGEKLEHVYFPVDSIISLLYVMENGASAEISVVGDEGILGAAVFLGVGVHPTKP
jgi:CRP-like cAMP-binding protein